MKKKLAVLLGVVLIVTVALAGCGAPKEAGGTSKAVQEAVDQAQPQIGALEEAFGGIMKIAITARGNSIVYTYTYTQALEADTATVKSSLETASEAQKATFESLVANMKAEKVDAPSIIIEYVDVDGNMIYTREFK